MRRAFFRCCATPDRARWRPRSRAWSATPRPATDAPFPGPTARARAEALAVEIPARLAPRSIDPAAPLGEASLARADRMALFTLATGAFGPQDCDVFGRVRAELFIGRVSDGVSGLSGAIRGDGGGRPEGVGGAVLEYRLAYQAWPRAGDRFVIRSGLAGFDDRTQRLAHWILDPATGTPWVTGEAVAIALDLQARKIIPLDEANKARLATQIKPGLSI